MWKVTWNELFFYNSMDYGFRNKSMGCGGEVRNDRDHREDHTESG